MGNREKKRGKVVICGKSNSENSVSLNTSLKTHTSDLLTWLIFYPYSLESTMHHHSILIPGC